MRNVLDEMLKLAGMEGIQDNDILQENFSDADFKKIAHMTDINAHGEAILFVAKKLGAKHLAKKLEHVNALHKLDGWLEEELFKYRHRIFKELMKIAKQKLSSEDYSRLEL